MYSRIYRFPFPSLKSFICIVNRGAEKSRSLPLIISRVVGPRWACVCVCMCVFFFSKWEGKVRENEEGNRAFERKHISQLIRIA